MPVPHGRKQQIRGAKRMKERGRKRVELWLDANEFSLIAGEAARAGKALATWIREAAFHTAQKSEQEAAQRRRPAY